MYIKYAPINNSNIVDIFESILTYFRANDPKIAIVIIATEVPTPNANVCNAPVNADSDDAAPITAPIDNPQGKSPNINPVISGWIEFITFIFLNIFIDFVDILNNERVAYMMSKLPPIIAASPCILTNVPANWITDPSKPAIAPKIEYVIMRPRL